MKNNLVLKSLIIIPIFLLIFWLAIFLPAGTTYYDNGWLFWITFSLEVIFFTVYFTIKDPRLMQSRLYGGPTAEKERLQQFIQAGAAISFFLLLIIPGISFRNHWNEFSGAVSIVSDLFILVGFTIVFLVFQANSFTSAKIEVQDEQKVISTGPYSLVRHPMYTGAFFVIIFTPLVLGSIVSLIFVFPVLGLVVLRIFDEEKFLSKNLKGYSEYCVKVKYRLVPGLW